ncbi:MAG: prepilin-type N-terminal cleavage/methylation domain-containing protein [Clostridia bacterium]|nr:prepilin-type N-terminal cleavage/methylation domain-containing protein [Clostridia bacterium]
MRNFFKKLRSDSWSKYFSKTVQRVGKNNAGFSLVELIVVIAIMAVLAAVAVIGVSIYIPKAQEATDNELLNVLTDALVAACLSEGVDQREITATIAVDANGKLVMNGNNIALDITSGVTADKETKIVTLFNEIYNDESTFNLSESNQIYYPCKEDNQVEYKFGWEKGTASVYDGIVFDPDDINAIKDSNFNKLGAGVLLDRVDLATGLLAGLAGDGGDNRVTELLLDRSNILQMAALMEWGSDEDVIDAKFAELINKKVALMKEQDSSLESMDPDELYAMAAREVLANNAVLIAATKSEYTQTDPFVVAMAEGNAKNIILNNLNAGETSTAISQAALVYGMYTSYAALNNIEISDDFDMRVVLNAMEEPGFKSYMATEAEKDLNAYNASMNMINTSTSNKEAVEDVLLNGFDSDSLNKIMSDALN